MHNIVHIWENVCLVTYLYLFSAIIHSNLTSQPLVMIGPFGGYWWVWSNCICQNKSKWQNIYMSLNNHNIMYLLVINYFDLIFSLTICLNSHYIFVQQGTTLFKFKHKLFCFFITKYIFLKSHTLSKYSCSHVYWTTIQCKEWDFDFSFNFQFIVFFVIVHLVVLGLALSFDN